MGYWSEVDVLMQEINAGTTMRIYVLPWWLEPGPFAPLLMAIGAAA